MIIGCSRKYCQTAQTVTDKPVLPVFLTARPPLSFLSEPGHERLRAASCDTRNRCETFDALLPFDLFHLHCFRDPATVADIFRFICHLPTFPIPFQTARLGLPFALGPSPCSPIYISNLCCRPVNLISASSTTFQFADPHRFSLYDPALLRLPGLGSTRIIESPLRDPTLGILHSTFSHGRRSRRLKLRFTTQNFPFPRVRSPVGASGVNDHLQGSTN